MYAVLYITWVCYICMLSSRVPRKGLASETRAGYGENSVVPICKHFWPQQLDVSEKKSFGTSFHFQI